MSVGLLSLIVLILSTIAYFVARARAMKSADGNARLLHSLPSYYGQAALLFTAVPAFILMAVWLLIQGPMIEARVIGDLGPAVAADANAAKLTMNDVRRIADGLDAMQERFDMSNEDLATMRADLTDVRGRLAEVGVALDSETKPEVFEGWKNNVLLKTIL